MEDKKMRDTKEIVLPKTYVLEGILETLSKDLDLTIKNKSLESQNATDMKAIRFVQGPNFKLDYTRWDMDENLEDEDLNFSKGDIEVYFSTYMGLSLSYQIIQASLEKHRDFLVNLSSGEYDLAMRLSLGKFRADTRNDKIAYQRLNILEEEIIPFLKAHIKY